jgi:hypothetical protein
VNIIDNQRCFVCGKAQNGEVPDPAGASHTVALCFPPPKVHVEPSLLLLEVRTPQHQDAQYINHILPYGGACIRLQRHVANLFND